VVQNTLTPGGESAILMADDLAGDARYLHGAPPGAPAKYLTGSPEVAMAEISEYISTREASERYRIAQEYLAYLARTEAIVARKMASDWLVLTASLEHYLANRPRPGLRKGQKITRPRKTAHA
jgi:hypothetical protein